MAAPFTQFEPTAGGLVLTNAIFLYKGEGRQEYAARGADAPAFATIHAVEHGAGPPTIAAGSPLSRGHLQQWAEVLGKTVVAEILPGNVLVSHPDVLAWWTPEQVRPAYFDLSMPPSRLKRLASRTTLPLPYPAHLFVATRSGLGVYALPESRRPEAATPILFSPVLNVFIDGHLCWGNIRRPRTLSVSSIPDFERAVFDSWSTHPNPGQEMTVTGKGGLVRLWDDLAARSARHFPVKRLKPFDRGGRRRPDAAPVTLGMLIAESIA